MPSRRTSCVWVTVAAVTVLSATWTWGREVTVKLRSGEEISGTLVAETAQSITIRTEAGAELRIGRDRLAGPIRERISLADEYRQRRARLADDNITDRLKLARWLHENTNPSEQKQAWTLALQEIDGILKVAPGSQEARFMREAVVANLRKLQDAAAEGQPVPPVDGAAGPVPAGGKGELLSSEQIARMKVFELDLRTRPRVVIPDRVVQEFLEKYTRDPVDPAMQPYLGRDGERVFKRLEGYEQLGIMFDVRAREFYDRVLVRDEPRSLQQFRTNIHTQYVMRYCGTCHYRDGVRGLDLHRGAPGHEATAYSNLMILANREHGGLPMISKTTPERSPLLQFGLPRSEAALPHPDVPGLSPYFRSRDDARFQAMVDWIRSLYSDPRDLLAASEAGASAGSSAGGAQP